MAERTPTAVFVDPPKQKRGGGRAPVHTPEIIASIAHGAKTGWTSNDLKYNSKSSAQAAAQRVKDLLVENGHSDDRKNYQSTVFSTNGDDGPFIFAVKVRGAGETEGEIDDDE